MPQSVPLSAMGTPGTAPPMPPAGMVPLSTVQDPAVRP
jgi:hypothetical protein